MSLDKHIPLLIGFCPLLVFHATHFLSASAGLVPWCNPYWEGCTSISATGRDGIAFYVFKATMLPAAVLLAMFWQGSWRRLSLAASPADVAPVFVHVGTVGAAFLTVYTLTLGIEGDSFQLERRIGVTIFFSFTYLAQLLFTWHLERHRLGGMIRHVLAGICLVTLVGGLLTVTLDLSIENYADYEDSFEWSITLMLQSYFVASYWTWRSLKKQRIRC